MNLLGTILSSLVKCSRIRKVVKKTKWKDSIAKEKMPKIDTLDALEEHEEHEDDYQTNSN